MNGSLLEKILAKVLSARFLLALMIGYTICRGFLEGKISAEAFLPITLLLFEWYFQRKDRKNGGEK